MLLQEGIAWIFPDVIIHLVEISILQIVDLNYYLLRPFFSDEDIAFLAHSKRAGEVVKEAPALQLKEVSIGKFVKHALDSFEPFLIG